ncbi:Fur-regulated basic protein FbpA [Sutcliffiella rhizosphaerae]|uniref:Stress response protein YkoL n=1 Tax=Sutcliffiella rhizosphaerae TaxID=2880967 RepID=A0ABN8A986_9BACI|nr:Fur-regulated basic protein FbpA [Sutcliffiella rhizosphaerae]CAG9620522.1 Stress response protein YkoL [Sutcliffiella rhizosphaerae]
MSNELKKALKQQREYYIDKLLLINVYNDNVLNGLTITELKEEYNYFYNDFPSKKLTMIRKA